MSRKINLINQRFGRWTVLKECEERKNKSIYWYCRCDCGVERNVRGGDLKAGKTLSCGCLQRERAAASNSLNLIGQRFNRLEVIEKTNERQDGMIIWKCKCDCGNIVTVPTSYLTTGDTGSCGCYQKDRINEACAKDITNQKFGKLTAIKPTEKRMGKSIIWECLCECGNITFVGANTLISGLTQSCGCIKSRGEKTISNLLREHNIQFEIQKTFDNCRFEDSKAMAKFDFYVQNKYLIEYDGEQHFMYRTTGWNNEESHLKLVKRDKYKNQWCKDNNIPLIRIPYTHLKDLCIEDLLLETSNYII